ncbi:M20 family metallopeptidase [Halalkalibacter kiskunsagensis]|uniref:M20 family metallopeptidase n=1 Tax=Halalkalibacter kiskunsagensis TaxID=1548599 RepID=A0ABV6KAZ5_9BACI
MEANQWHTRLIKWRRHLHQYPELSFQEVETTKYIIDQLQGLPGVTIATGVEQLGLQTGALVTVGDGEKPIIGLRADIDALPIKEETEAAYQSCRPGVMHACGHDGHTAMLLGAVFYLSKLYELKKLHGTVKCLFQPAEETEDNKGNTGAQYVLQSGILEGTEAIIALHLDPELPLGEVKLTSGLVMANVDTFTITIMGTGGHGAYPEQSVDPIWLTSLVLPYLYSMSHRQLSALEPSVLSICQITGGASSNVIPSSVVIKGTMRTYSQTAREHLAVELKKGLETIRGLGGAYDLSLHLGEPALYNDSEIVDVLECAIKTIRPDVTIHKEPYGMGGEDFSHLTTRFKGAMLFLGAFDQTKRKTSLHQPTFCFDECALELGMQTLIKSTLLLLKKGGNINGT